MTTGPTYTHGLSRGCTLLPSSTTTFPCAPRPGTPFPGLHGAPRAHIYFKSTFYNRTEALGVQLRSLPSHSAHPRCSSLQPHWLFEGVLFGVHTTPHLSIDLSPTSTMRALCVLLPTSFQLLLCFSISECFSAHGLAPFCNCSTCWSLNVCNVPLWASKSPRGMHRGQVAEAGGHVHDGGTPYLVDFVL